MVVEGAGQGAAEAVAEWTVGAAGTALEWLHGVLTSAGAILTDLWPPVLAGIAAILALRALRWWLLIWRGRTPRVQISNFAWASSDQANAEATWVTSLFREKLAGLRLDALDPLPERAPGAPLVEIVEGVGQGISRNLDMGKALGRFFRAVFPDAAYEVWGTLRPKEEGDGGRISVQLVERRRGYRTLLNIALESGAWEEGARDAALAVAGALYPRVRHRDRGPWAMWDRTVPRKLMDDYHTARRHEEENRLEHALDRYHKALDQDPLNPNLRLKIAMLQERLELYLDAWVTYEAIVDESDYRAWRGPNRRVYMIALYRVAVLLSGGSVADQWVKNAHVAEGKGTKRDDERRRRRDELMMSLTSDPWFERPPRSRLLSAPQPSPTLPTASFRIASFSSPPVFAMLHRISSEDPKWGKLAAVFEAPPHETEAAAAERARRIDAVLLILSLRRLEQLDAWRRVRPPVRFWRWLDWWRHRPAVTQWLSRRELSRSAVQTSKLLARLRIAAALENRLKENALARGGAGDGHSPGVKEMRQAHRSLTRRWPFPARGPWRRVAHFIAPRRRWANRREDAWQLHYNAACAAASVLRDDSVLANARAESESPHSALPRGTRRPHVIKRVRDQLEEYAHRAGSSRVAAQADWIAIDDPDLQGMRHERAFLLWASHHLPRGLPPKQPSRKVDVRRFTVRVAYEGAVRLPPAGASEPIASSRRPPIWRDGGSKSGKPGWRWAPPAEST